MDEQANLPAAPNPDSALIRRAGLEMAVGQHGLQLRTMTDALAFGQAMITSGFVPRGFTKPAHVVWAVQRGAELGLGPAASLDAFWISPNGRPALYVEAAWALVLNGGLVEDWNKEIAGTGDSLVATFRVKRVGHSWHESKFSIAEAKAAGLVKAGSGWANWPQRMVWMRALGFGIRDAFPDKIRGLRFQHEVADEPGIHAVPLGTPPAAELPESPADVADPLLDSVIETTTTPVTPRVPPVQVNEDGSVTGDVDFDKPPSGQPQSSLFR